jgi:TonB-dependent receptor
MMQTFVRRASARFPSASRAALIVAGFLLSSLAFAPAAVAQATGGIAGTVTDETGRPLTGLSVSIAERAGEFATGRTGGYRVPRLPAGRYTLQIRGLGYATEERLVTVLAGEVAREDVVMSVEAVELQSLLVEGQRFGQARALNQQKTASNVKEVVAAENIGRFPDPNTAEAIQRMTSVIVQRDQGEGRFVQVRGTEPRLSAVKINGVEVPAPEGDTRVVALDVIPSDMLASVELSRTLTPDMDADAIGGSVNLVTRAPEDRTVFNVTAAGGYNDLTSNPITQLAGTFGSRFGAAGQFGLVVGGSWYRTERGSDNIEQEFGDVEIDGTDVDVLEEFQMRLYDVTRERIGVNGTFDWLAGDRSRLYLSGIFNDYSDQEFRYRQIIGLGEGDYLNANTVEGAEVERELKDRLETQQIWNLTLGGNHDFGVARFDWLGAYSFAEESEPRAYYSNFKLEGVNYAVSRADPGNPLIDPTNTAEANPYDASQFEFDEYVDEDNLTEDENWIGAANLLVPYRLGASFGELKAGGKVRFKTKSRNNIIDIFDGFDGDYFLSEVATSPVRDPFYFGRYDLGPSPASGSTRSFTSEFADLFEQDDEASLEDSAGEDYEADENVFAGYVMTTHDVGRLRIIPGLRVEYTDLAYRGTVLDFNTDGDLDRVTEVSASDDYTDFLPGLNLRYELTDRTNLRAAATRTLARPDHFDLVPYAIVNREDDELELGNPELLPTRSWNFDLLADHYFSSVGVVTAGIFYKDLTDYIFVNRFEQESGPYEGFDVTQPQNAGSGSVFGLEFGLQQQLNMLPGFFGGFGLGGNLVWTSSDATIPGREEEDLELPGQAELAGNAYLSYEKYGFQGRLVLNFHDDFLFEVGEDAAEDTFYRQHIQLDLSAAQRIAGRWQIFLEMVNLTDEPYIVYQGDRSQPIQQEYYSWWGHLGIKYSL